MALPDFGLMTKADKLKLDAIDTTTLLTKTEAATTYATKEEMRLYVRQVVESDTGFVLINGNDSEVGVIPTMTNRKATPTLSADPASITAGPSDASGKTITVTTNSDGAISAELSLPEGELPDEEDADEEFDVSIDGALEGPFVNGNVIWFGRGIDCPNDMTYHYTVTISVAETENFAAASIEVPFTVTGL